MVLSSEFCLEKWMAQYGRTSRALVVLLLAIQDHYNYLPASVLRELLEKTEIEPTHLQEVATFYSHFRFQPAGKHRIRVCTGTACYVKGADQVHQAFVENLKIPPGEDTDPTGTFTLEKVACIGCCMMAPAVQMDQQICGWVDSGQVKKIKEDFLSSSLENKQQPPLPSTQKPLGEVKICLCSSCTAVGAQKIYRELTRCAGQYKIPLRPLEVGCTGMSFRSPLLQITDSQGRIYYYSSVDVDGVASLLLHHFKPKSLHSWLDRLLTMGSHPLKPYQIEPGSSQPWETLQTRIATAQAGMIPPDDLEGYRQSGGFSGLERAMALSPEEIIQQIIQSGLRGRGGAGFPTGIKWRLTAQAKGEQKFVIANGDEGDPGAFMDRMVLESFPFRVIEGILIASLAVGARRGIFYVREEYPLAISRLQRALEICSRADFLGEILQKVELEVARGAGAFVCGEETSLIGSLEGRRPIPHLRPPYPAQKGLFGWPTLINNVETLATVPWILREGPEAFRQYGRADSKGTKTFALSGKIQKGGLIEVPMGKTLDFIVNQVGGGVEKGRSLKALLIGGPSGGCVPGHLLDLSVDYEALRSTGAMMGSGGLVVLDEHDCMVDLARYFLSFTARESCGKCTFCRIGTQGMLDLLNNLCQGRGKKGDLERLDFLSRQVQRGSLCGLGRTAPNPVLTGLKFFREEYQAHIDGFCPAGKCENLFQFTITDLCNGCTICAQNCAPRAIPFAPWQQAHIDQDRCNRCGICREVCPQKALEVRKK